MTSYKITDLDTYKYLDYKINHKNYIIQVYIGNTMKYYYYFIFLQLNT